MSFEEAASLPVAALPALNGLMKCGVSRGTHVLINGGTGGVGHFAVQIARARDAIVTVTSSSGPGKQAIASKEVTPGSNETSLANVPGKPAPKFAFLKVATTPPGAEVYINGALKGKTPIILRLDLGQYQVRLTHAGHKEVERLITLEKMMEYPLTESLKPLE